MLNFFLVAQFTRENTFKPPFILEIIFGQNGGDILR